MSLLLCRTPSLFYLLRFHQFHVRKSCVKVSSRKLKAEKVLIKMLPVHILLARHRRNINRQENIRRANIERRILRHENDPFTLRGDLFMKTFRLNKDMVRHLLEELVPYLNQTENVVAISNMRKVLITLNFYGTGSYQRGVGQNMCLNVSQPMVSKIIKEVSLAITEIVHNWIRFPQTAEEKQEIKRIFMHASNFPGTIGAIDCTHVAIIAPVEQEHNYLNRKGYHSKNVQFICDYNLRILNVNAIYGGASHDSYIWRNSTVNREMERAYNQGNRNEWLVGDSGYPQQCWLMTPIANAAPGTPEFAYTQAQMRARNCVERCFGVLKSRFRCILGERRLRYDPETVSRIVVACAMLHNMCIIRGVEEINYVDGFDDNINNNVPHLNNAGNQARANLIREYFQ